MMFLVLLLVILLRVVVVDVSAIAVFVEASVDDVVDIVVEASVDDIVVETSVDDVLILLLLLSYCC